MSAVIAALANPAVDAMAAQLILQGFQYWQTMSDKRAAGQLTEQDARDMAQKLDVDFDGLLLARAEQRDRERAAQQQAAQQQVHSEGVTAQQPTPGTGPTTGQPEQVGGNAT